MSKNAEEKANKRWPIHPWSILPKEGEHGEIINFDEWLDDYRIWVQSFSLNAGYKEGYEQAEKDLALTWEDIKIIVKILADSDWYDFELNGKLWSKEFYEEVLKRFEERKK